MHFKYSATLNRARYSVFLKDVTFGLDVTEFSINKVTHNSTCTLFWQDKWYRDTYFSFIFLSL
jgi:hypothetical protein